MRWCRAEQKKLRNKLAKIESRADCADEVKRLKNYLANVEVLLRNLKGDRLVG